MEVINLLLSVSIFDDTAVLPKHSEVEALHPRQYDEGRLARRWWELPLSPVAMAVVVIFQKKRHR